MRIALLAAASALALAACGTTPSPSSPSSSATTVVPTTSGIVPKFFKTTVRTTSADPCCTLPKSTVALPVTTAPPTFTSKSP